jgi:PUA-domain protein
MAYDAVRDCLLSLRHRHYLKGKEVLETLQDLKTAIPQLNIEGLKECGVEVASLDTDEQLYLVEGKPAFLRTEKGVFPALLNKEALESVPTIIVDAGAVPHICNGSALMAPGIVRIEGKFLKGAMVVVKEVNYGKMIALVKVMLDSEEIAMTKKGRVAVNVHYVGDKLWNSYKNVS